MDEFDIELYHLLIRDPRLPYRELAERMNISLQAVHKRMHALLEAGILVGTGAAIPDSYFNATAVFIYGRIDSDRPLKEIISDLSKNDAIGFVMLCSSNYIYVSGVLRRVADMEQLHEFVMKTCGLKDSTMAIESLGKVGDVKPSKPMDPETKLSPLDLRIISSMKNDARKPLEQIGEEVGATARTVRQRLDRMLEEGSIELRVLVNPTESTTMTSVIHVYTREGVGRNAFGVELMQKYPTNVLFFRSYINIPDMISLAGNHPTTAAFNVTMRMLVDDERVKKVVPNVVITAWSFDTWKEKMLPKLKQ